ncbi:hypothetical protein J7E78_11305 [Paenibacillus polymyxa]|uniref:YiiX/YebB-like N1pC/P60 family cysteine hydrolase n=1 Tax=Paenibacillus polymyxa TaxID=1406 RepID=UPI001BE980FC|nr:YiiX/YebB-like N1pC/P60 family cysteine hydrolase [Paenibacillus polymyxa]MBT2284125.1 hypothetical protein [Paenibacillus polymyxa]
MKKTMILLLVFAMSLFTVGAANAKSLIDDSSAVIQAIPNEYYPGTSTVIRPGDVIITNNTSSNGLTGHAGIVIDPGGTIVTIPGYFNKMIRQSVDSWMSSNPNTKIYRYGNSSTAQAAADWASTYQRDFVNRVHYGLVNALGDYGVETYCSKIVWDAYYFGGGYAIGSHSRYSYYPFTPYEFKALLAFKLVGATGANF